MARVKSFAIDRRVWLRGEGLDSCLLRPEDGKRCCVGIYLSACGVGDAQMSNVPDAEDLTRVPSWLQDDRIGNLYSDNDEFNITADERERRIAEGFAKHGVTVTFEN